MPSTQELTRRIKSIKSTRKVTRAMQMVSASKMRKAQGQALASRTYAEIAQELVQSLVSTSPSLSSFESEREGSSLRVDDYSRRGTNADRGSSSAEVSSGSPPKIGGARGGMNPLGLLESNSRASKIAVVIVSTNKGLVGSFNTNLLLKLRDIEQEWVAKDAGRSVDVIVIGRKVAEATARLGKHIVADFPKSDGGERVEDVYKVAKQIAKMYGSGEYAKVHIVYNHFVSTLTQKAVVQQLLPFAPSVIPVSTSESPSAGRPESRIKNEGMDSGYPSQSLVDAGMTNPVNYTFEPSPEEVINHLLPRIIESQLYQALLESDASEHSARMIMMKNATDSAGDLIADLTLTFNQLRQNKITTELSEITAGKIALEGS